MIYFWIIYAILMIISMLLPKHQPTPEAPTPAGLEDFSVPIASQGSEIPVLFGTRWLDNANVVWYGDLGINPKLESSGGGGKKG